jgi:general secretion pathway protein H
MRVERGFTLIEILVVVLIIGITIGFAMLAFGDFGASRKAVLNAEQFSAYVKLVQQQAIIEGNSLGISVSSGGYSTFRFENGSWKPMPAKGIFHNRNFPDNVFAIMKSNLKNNRFNPDIIIDSSGETSLFAIDFGTSQKPDVITLVNKGRGQLVMQRQVKR